MWCDVYWYIYGLYIIISCDKIIILSIFLKVYVFIISIKY